MVLRKPIPPGQTPPSQLNSPLSPTTSSQSPQVMYAPPPTADQLKSLHSRAVPQKTPSPPSRQAPPVPPLPPVPQSTLPSLVVDISEAQDDSTNWWDDSDDDVEPEPVPVQEAPLPPQSPQSPRSSGVIKRKEVASPVLGSQTRSRYGSTDQTNKGFASLTIDGQGASRDQLVRESSNPFFEGSLQPRPDDIESTASIWSSHRQAAMERLPSSPAPQPSRPAVPDVSNVFANGHMSDMSASFDTDSKDALFGPRQTLDPPEIENPWGNSKGMAQRQQDVPPPSSQSSKAKRPQIPSLELPPPLPANKPDAETPMTKDRRQRSEFYQIKHIRWHDKNARENPRLSPIIVQNANGPCPLLALVNALVLSTPPTTSTVLLETLSSREQVSLGLLLDAVFDELMSGRRGDAAQELPDVGELYSFLLTLHTGMNVNPRFVDPASDNLLDIDEPRAGGFENTREMVMYRTFAVPLMHGWLPARSDDAYASFQRAAQTYEDAQNYQFREEEFEQKFRNGQLTDEEHILFVDLTTIKDFLSTWPTQLSDHGLQTLKHTIQPGQVAILFRNDHFSTLYKHPTTNRLMTLVTDAGYASHDEIVWESLADISGTNSELFSGDFRSVTHHEQGGVPQYDDGEWQTVKPKNPRTRTTVPTNALDQPAPSASAAAMSPPQTSHHSRTTSEQEDHDLALALQLQEEEEQRSRSDQAARLAENQATERFLSQESARQGPQPSPRASATARVAGNGRAPVSRIEEWSEEEGGAPPPYEQAMASPVSPRVRQGSAQQRGGGSGGLYSQNANTQVYAGHSQYPGRGSGGGANGSSPINGGRRRLSAQVPAGHHGAHARGGGVGGGGSVGPMRRMGTESGMAHPPAGQHGQGQGQGEEDKCVVM